MWNGSKLMACLELERIDSTIEKRPHFAKILPNNTTTLEHFDSGEHRSHFRDHRSNMKQDSADLLETGNSKPTICFPSRDFWRNNKAKFTSPSVRHDRRERNRVGAYR